MKTSPIENKPHPSEVDKMSTRNFWELKFFKNNYFFFSFSKVAYHKVYHKDLKALLLVLFLT